MIKLLYIHRENNCKTKLLITKSLRQELHAFHVSGHLTCFSANQLSVDLHLFVESSQFPSNSTASSMDLEDFAAWNLLSHVEYEQDKI